MDSERNMTIADDGYREFFDFIKERHTIWYRRNVLGMAQPWTDDPILATRKFCNVYRELDRGTIWYMENVVQGMGGDDFQVLFQTIVYRLINTIEIFERIGGVPTLEDYNAKNFEAKIREVKKTVPWNTAYVVFHTWHQFIQKKDIKGKKDIIHALSLIIEKIAEDFAVISVAILEAETLRGAWAHLRLLPNIGPFLAYEIVCDLMLADVLPFTENDFVNVGPGAMQGLEIIYGKKMSAYQAVVLCEHLAVIQHTFLDEEYYKMGKPLTLRSIEHSLCEFRKYHNIKTRGKGGKHFNPTM